METVQQSCTDVQQVVDWKEAHDTLSRIARERAANEHEEARWLLVALRTGAHLRLGYGMFTEYLERLFGYTPRQAIERLRVAEALQELPETDEALRTGALTWSSVRELTRVATPETERAWIDSARSRTAREVEELVSGHDRGDLPTDAASDETRRHVLRFEVSADVFATFRDAVGRITRDAGGGISDEDALLLMARRVLGGPGDEGRANYQIRMTVCSSCKQGWQDGRGQAVAVTSDAVEMAECDAQRVPDTHVGTPKAKQDMPPSIRRLIVQRDHGRCIVAGCRSSVFCDVHHFDRRDEGGKHDPERMGVLCGAHHRAVHRGFLIIEGTVSGGLTFRHADGTAYGGPASAQAAGAFADAFSALRNLGFKEKDTRAALDAARAHVGPAPTLEEVVRAALA